MADATVDVKTSPPTGQQDARPAGGAPPSGPEVNDALEARVAREPEHARLGREPPPVEGAEHRLDVAEVRDVIPESFMGDGYHGLTQIASTPSRAR